MIIINEGDGKGKTTAALGQAIRAKGQGLRVKVIQFIKNGESGEIEMLKKLGINVEQYGLGFTDKGDKSDHKIAAERALQAINNLIDHGDVAEIDNLTDCKIDSSTNRNGIDMIICDEINYAISGGLIAEEDVLKLMDKAHNKKIHLVMTGRNPTDKMIEIADIVTNMTKIKHAFDNGIKAQAGIEF